ncbi:DUF134 domain-containing protein [Chloroflexota bacterium]
MPRPMKCRRVAFLPQATYFKPAGIPMRVLDEVRMSVEEAEAIRLKDLEGFEQEEGAKRMSVSRPTFQRILASGRQKLADALLNGKAMRIEGGSFGMALNQFRCKNGHEWEIPFETMVSRPPQLCPECSTTGIEQLVPDRAGWRGQGSGRRRGMQRG